MNHQPKLVSVPPELAAAIARKEAALRGAQDALYAREVFPAFAPLFADLPLHGAPPGFPRPRALISVLGLSWQPVALMARWARPERLLVVGTEASFQTTVDGRDVLALLAEAAGLPVSSVATRVVEETAEADIYRTVRQFVQATGFAPREVFLDATGGKKSMSASAALAGFLLGTPLVYVDYGRYDAAGRHPVVGTEHPRLLTNPLDEFGDLEYRSIFDAFNRGDFREADHRATALATRLYEPRAAEALAQVACGYAHLDAFEWSQALSALREALGLVRRYGSRWGWVPPVEAALSAQLPRLEVAAAAGERPDLSTEAVRLAAMIAGGRRAARVGRTANAVLHAYAAVERYCDACLWERFRLDDEAPDYDAIRDHLDLKRYDDAGAQLFPNYQRRDPVGPLQFGNGLQLLHALAPELVPAEDLPRLRGLASVRNRLPLQHGRASKTPSPEDANKHLDTAVSVISAGVGTGFRDLANTFAIPHVSNPYDPPF